MTEIRTKDKLFLAGIVPAALLAAYWYVWRADAGRRMATLEGRRSALVTEEDFPMEKLQAEREFTAAMAELEAEKKIPMPQATMKADPQDHAASRERQTLQAFRDAGLTVAGSKNVGADGQNDAQARKAGELLKATGSRPFPIRRSYTIDGRYPDIVKALRYFSERKMAVIPDKVQMRPDDRNRWTVEVWQ